jgi:phosphoenolpyruvate carboxylase
VFNEWERRLEHLEQEKETIEEEHQEEYEGKIESLKERLTQIQVRLRAMEEGEPKEWIVGQENLREKMESFKANLDQISGQIEEEEREDSFWSDAFSDVTGMDSEVWVAGIHGGQSLTGTG